MDVGVGQIDADGVGVTTWMLPPCRMAALKVTPYGADEESNTPKDVEDDKGRKPLHVTKVPDLVQESGGGLVTATTAATPAQSIG